MRTKRGIRGVPLLSRRARLCVCYGGDAFCSPRPTWPLDESDPDVAFVVAPEVPPPPALARPGGRAVVHEGRTFFELYALGEHVGYSLNCQHHHACGKNCRGGDRGQLSHQECRRGLLRWEAACCGTMHRSGIWFHQIYSSPLFGIWFHQIQPSPPFGILFQQIQIKIHSDYVITTSSPRSHSAYGIWHMLSPNPVLLSFQHIASPNPVLAPIRDMVSPNRVFKLSPLFALWVFLFSENGGGELGCSGNDGGELGCK